MKKECIHARHRSILGFLLSFDLGPSLPLPPPPYVTAILRVEGLRWCVHEQLISYLQWFNLAQRDKKQTMIDL
jgi:hypothetical protein